MNDVDLMRLYQTMGELEAQTQESVRQREVLFELVSELTAEVRDLRAEVGEHRLEFATHVKGEKELAAIVHDYRQNKQKAIGVLAVLGIMATFIGIAISSWIKGVIERLMA